MTHTKINTLDLIKRYKSGEKHLLDIILKENEALAYSLVNRYRVSKKEEKEDLTQVALMGLLKAIDNFDFNYQVTFSTYAVPIILGEIKKYFRDSSFLKVSRNLKDLYYQIEKEKNNYLKEYGKEITLDELETKFNIDRYDLVLAMESNISPLSIEKEYENEKDSGFSLENIIGESKGDRLLDLLTLNDALETLSDKEKIVINLRFYNECSQKEVAEKFNVSQVQISRIEKHIIEKLKKFF